MATLPKLAAMSVRISVRIFVFILLASLGGLVCKTILARDASAGRHPRGRASLT